MTFLYCALESAGGSLDSRPSIHSMPFINCADRIALDNLLEISLELEKVMMGSFEVGLRKDTSLHLQHTLVEKD